jgi:hypothetical protein
LPTGCAYDERHRFGFELTRVTRRRPFSASMEEFVREFMDERREFDGGRQTVQDLNPAAC